jgi:hypothetical protein
MFTVDSLFECGIERAQMKRAGGDTAVVHIEGSLGG